MVRVNKFWTIFQVLCLLSFLFAVLIVESRADDYITHRNKVVVEQLKFKLWSEGIDNKVTTSDILPNKDLENNHSDKLSSTPEIHQVLKDMI